MQETFLSLAPVQVRLLPVRPDHYDYVKEVAAKMRAAGIRAEADTNGDRLGKMVRNAEKQKIPVMSVVGDQEVADNTLSIRTRASGELGAIAIEEVISKLTTAISEHSNF